LRRRVALRRARLKLPPWRQVAWDRADVHHTDDRPLHHPLRLSSDPGRDAVMSYGLLRNLLHSALR
jgi:hypothetical protein